MGYLVRLVISTKCKVNAWKGRNSLFLPAVGKIVILSRHSCKQLVLKEDNSRFKLWRRQNSL